jgi:hypothetical protein
MEKLLLNNTLLRGYMQSCTAEGPGHSPGQETVSLAKTPGGEVKTVLLIMLGISGYLPGSYCQKRCADRSYYLHAVWKNTYQGVSGHESKGISMGGISKVVLAMRAEMVGGLSTGLIGKLQGWTGGGERTTCSFHPTRHSFLGNTRSGKPFK